jgi:hypothetical protein
MSSALLSTMQEKFLTSVHPRDEEVSDKEKAPSRLRLPLLSSNGESLTDNDGGQGFFLLNHLLWLMACPQGLFTRELCKRCQQLKSA